MPANTGAAAPALMVSKTAAGALLFRLDGRLDSSTTGTIWRQAVRAMRQPSDLILDATNVHYCDISGIGFLVNLRNRQEQVGRRYEIRGLKEEFGKLLDIFSPQKTDSQYEEPRHMGFFEQIGRATVDMWSEMKAQLTFVGELIANLAGVLLRRQKIRWKDGLHVAEAVGVNALPVIALMGLILGIIVAFQGAIPLRRYGGEMLVADMVILAMFREMGPLFTAIILAARSGSAFAAELGTMKVNEEIDALTTMGLNPIPFLAVPRVLAGVCMMPLLTMITNIMGLIGGGFVFLGLGFTLTTYVDRLLLRGSAVDLVQGLIRSVVFGIIVAGVGCLQGLRTGKGARAVGESTTKSVVSSIILIILADGTMSVVFYFLGV